MEIGEAAKQPSESVLPDGTRVSSPLFSWLKPFFWFFYWADSAHEWSCTPKKPWAEVGNWVLKPQITMKRPDSTHLVVHGGQMHGWVMRSSLDTWGSSTKLITSWTTRYTPLFSHMAKDGKSNPTVSMKSVCNDDTFWIFHGVSWVTPKSPAGFHVAELENTSTWIPSGHRNFPGFLYFVPCWTPSF